MKLFNRFELISILLAGVGAGLTTHLIRPSTWGALLIGTLWGSGAVLVNHWHVRKANPTAPGRNHPP